MTFANYMDVLVRRWLTVVICLLLALAAATAYTLLATKVYRAQTITFVSLRQNEAEGNMLQGSQFTLQRVKSYPQVVTSTDVLQPVIDKLQLGMTVPQLQNDVRAVNPADTVLLYISATSSSPQRAADIANEVTAQFSTVVENLERPEEGETSPVKVTITEAAIPPTSPTSPRLTLNLLIGAILGLAVGVGLALLRQVLDTTLRTTRILAELSGTPSLGSITTHSGNTPVTGMDDAALESYRTLRTNLAFIDQERPRRQLVITSPSKGDGRTTIVCNLAYAMSRAGLRVLMVDADLRSPSLAQNLGIPASPGLSDVLRGKVDVEEASHKWAGGQVIGAGTEVQNPSELLSSQAMTDLLDYLSEHYDVVLLDSPPILHASDAAVLARQAHGAVLLARWGRSTRHEVEEATEALGAVGARLIGCVLTFTAPSQYSDRSKRGRRRRQFARS